MSSDYRNLLISNKQVDWNDIIFSKRNVYDIYEMKINYIYVYFVHSIRCDIFNDDYLKYYKSNTILISQSDCGNTIDLLHYTGSEVLNIDDIPDYFVYDDYLDDYGLEDATRSFIELLGPAITNKVDKYIELSDEELLTIATIFKYFLFDYDELPEHIKSQIVKLH